MHAEAVVTENSSRSTADLSAHARVTRGFLADTIRVLWLDDNAAVRVKLGAEHTQEWGYALNSLDALLDVLGVQKSATTHSDCAGYQELGEGEQDE